MKFILILFSFLVFSWCLTHHRSRHQKHLESDSLKRYYATQLSSLGLPTLGSKLSCEENEKWNDYFGKMISGAITGPNNLVKPDKCKFLWMYSLKENQIKAYLNSCLKTKKIGFAADGRVTNQVGEHLNNIEEFTKNLKKEASFSGADCDGSQAPSESGGADIFVSRCVQSSMRQDLLTRDYLLTTTFLSTSMNDDCHSEGKVVISLRIDGKNKNQIGRDIHKYSAHWKEKEYLVLPGQCFRRLPRKSDADPNRISYESMETGCNNA